MPECPRRMKDTTTSGRIPTWLSRRSPAAARLLTAGLLGLATPGCLVRQGLYDEARAEIQRERDAGDKARAEAQSARAEAQSARAEAAQRSAQVAAIKEELARLSDDLRARDLRLSEATTAEAGLARRLDELIAMNEELSARLRSAGQSVGQLAGERGSLSAELAETRAKLDDLRRKQAAAEARAAGIRDAVDRLKGAAFAGKVRVGLRAGQLVIEVPSDALFNGARAELTPEGRAALDDIAGVLRTMPAFRFQVAAHTDNDRKAMKSARFSSSWDLSAARATAVVKRLVERGMSPRGLSTVGYGEFSPVGPNDTEAGRARNRRVEILVVAEQETPGEAEKATGKDAQAGGG
ncbi:Probable outer membrane protein [Sorangium cellulosum So ce56]|uniref:Probable outer membrane protein n=2 Tax=Sorangium cellulosum TaxID=56 RepID=A9GRD8_SORC5|nr:Probable outer membrane protein [Sorangium cellulosum So ce56]